MGCKESKIKRINLTPDSSYSPQSTRNPILETISGTMDKEILEQTQHYHPNRLTAAFPLPDLGESLDSTHLNLNSSLNLSNKNSPILHYAGDESADSGYDEYEEGYTHIITENSSEELVNSVITEFKPVDLPELLVITGRACTRKLSGYQKDKINEAKILDTLRKEGLLAKSCAKTNGGFSFEVVDQTVKSNNFVTSDFMPSKTLARLESRREHVKKTNTDIEDRLATAETRRKAAEEEKIEKCREICGIERNGKSRLESATRKEQRYSASIAKRQMHLQEIRDKLKQKHKKHEFKRLKNNLRNGSPLERRDGGREESHFFDD
ncbi:uncharacterized protein [Lepeophtheirus salmonis]|uniref:uncharacterized protein n=1 Tax=Lepeophtheirus salmonis TaxID=72036 RepID=UPI001AE84D70|nr:uncharacterized protein LOC121114704 [Lepeophtheirus salmonis]